MSTHNAKSLANLYELGYSTYLKILSDHQVILKKMASRYKVKGKLITRRTYNDKQLEYIVNKVFQMTPYGYEFDGKNLVKSTEATTTK